MNRSDGIFEHDRTLEQLPLASGSGFVKHHLTMRKAELPAKIGALRLWVEFCTLDWAVLPDGRERPAAGGPGADAVHVL